MAFTVLAGPSSQTSMLSSASSLADTGGKRLSSRSTRRDALCNASANGIGLTLNEPQQPRSSLPRLRLTNTPATIRSATPAVTVDSMARPLTWPQSNRRVHASNSCCSSAVSVGGPSVTVGVDASERSMTGATAPTTERGRRRQ